MFLAQMDFTSDGVIFFIALFAFGIVLAVLMERASPRRKSRRRVDRVGNKTGGRLID